MSGLLRLLFASGILGLLIFGCAESQPLPRDNPSANAPRQRSPARVKHPPKTLALLNFENNSVTAPEQYAPLSKGIPAMLITDLSRTDSPLKIIEREKIQSLLKETALSQMGGVDESKAIRAGKILGAESIGFGSFIVLRDTVRIDTRIIGTETGEVIMAESIMGKSSRFMELVSQLGGKIASALQAELRPATTGSDGDIKAALVFSRGLEAWDRGNPAEARTLFQKAAILDPGYGAKADKILAESRQRVTDAEPSPGFRAQTSPVSFSESPSESSKVPEADVKTVEAEGISFISRADAVRQAQRASVEQAVGVFVHSRTEMENFEVKKERIFSRTQGYIRRFQIIKELEADGQYIVSIRAQVSLKKIKDDLIAMKILLDAMERPKVMILLEENYTGMAGMGMNFAEAEMLSIFKKKGFELVDENQLRQIKAQDGARQALNGNDDAAKQLGLSMGAQYVVLGKAMVQDIGEAYPGTGLRSIQAGLQIRILQTMTGLILGSTVKTAAAAHASPMTGASIALKKAVQKASDEYVVDAVTDSFQDFLNNGAPLKLYVSGVRAFGESADITAAISELEGMAGSKKEGWNSAGGMLILDLRFRGTSEELARLLDGMKLGAKSLSVTDVAPDRVECAFR